MLRPAARHGHIVPQLSHTLLAVATRCDAGYEVTFDTNQVRITDNGNVVLTGHRHAPTGLWQLPIPPAMTIEHTIHFANRAGDSTEADLVAFAHATLFSPVVSTLEAALRNNLLTNFPGLSAAALHRHPPQSIATAKGHLDQVRRNLRSTKNTHVIAPEQDDLPYMPDDAFPPQIATKTHACYAAIIDSTGQIFSDQTGRFVVPSSSGNNYIMVVYDYDSNHIFAHPFKNRTAKCILDTFKHIHQRLLCAGLPLDRLVVVFWHMSSRMHAAHGHHTDSTETRKPRICNTVEWFPTQVSIPSNSSNDQILATLCDITNALRRPSPRSPIAPRTDSLNEALQQLLRLLNNIVLPQPDLPPPPPATALEPASPLRVAAPPATNPTNTPSDSTPHIIPLDDPPVIPTPADTPTPIATPTNDPIIPPLQDDPTDLPTSNHPAATDSPAAAIPPTTYHDVTGPQVTAAKRRQRYQRSKKQKRPARSNKHKQPTRRSRRIPKPRALTANTPFTDLELFDQPIYLCCHGTAINPDTGFIAKYQELIKSSDGHLWEAANDEEVGRMCTGLGPDSTVPTGTQTLEFIFVHDLPKDKKHVRVVCQPQRIRWTLGGDKIIYLGNKTTQTADLKTAKIMFNSVLSTPGARFMTIDLKDFYLNSTLPQPEFVRVPVHMISPWLIDLYNLRDKIHNGYLYARVNKGMYGLPQAGKLANDELVAHPANNMPPAMNPLLSAPTIKSLSAKLSAPSYIMGVPKTLPCFPPLAPSPPNNLHQPN